MLSSAVLCALLFLLPKETYWSITAHLCPQLVQQGHGKDQSIYYLFVWHKHRMCLRYEEQNMHCRHSSTPAVCESGPLIQEQITHPSLCSKHSKIAAQNSHASRALSHFFPPAVLLLFPSTDQWCETAELLWSNRLCRTYLEDVLISSTEILLVKDFHVMLKISPLLRVEVC